MFDNANRAMWLEDQVWPRIRDKFGIVTIPKEILVTVSYPSSGARGRSSKLKVAEYTTQWQGNANEVGMFAVHPIAFKSPDQIVGAIAWAALKAQNGARWGAVRGGLTKTDAAVIEFSPEAKAKVDAIIAEMGEPPAGYGVAFPCRASQRTRLRKYVANDKFCDDGRTEHKIIRAATDTGTFQCSTCQTQYTLA